MSEEWRSILYPFGFLAQLAFGLRFAIQWLKSERDKQSVTPPIFWYVSLAGNLLMALHSLIQLHFPLSVVQLLNAVLSWRNLNLLQPKEKQRSFQFVLGLFLVVIVACCLFFSFQPLATSWITTPQAFDLSWGFHLFGLFGIACFALRFWIQWWQAEKRQEATLTEPFWWISLCGAALCLIYFFILNDWVNFIGPILSLVPYTRNLILIKKMKLPTKQPSSTCVG